MEPALCCVLTILQMCELCSVVRGLVDADMTWEQVESKYPLFTGQQSTN